MRGNCETARHLGGLDQWEAPSNALGQAALQPPRMHAYTSHPTRHNLACNESLCVAPLTTETRLLPSSPNQLQETHVLAGSRPCQSASRDGQPKQHTARLYKCMKSNEDDKCVLLQSARQAHVVQAHQEWELLHAARQAHVIQTL